MQYNNRIKEMTHTVFAFVAFFVVFLVIYACMKNPPEGFFSGNTPPQHHYCFEIAGSERTATKIDPTPTERKTVSESKTLCDETDTCSFFTCDMVNGGVESPGNGNICTNMAMYDETGTGSKTSIVSGTESNKKEVHKKSTEACVQNMKSDAYQQTYLYPNTYNIGGRMKRNSYNVGAKIDMPKQIHKRACRSSNDDEENGIDTNCFLINDQTTNNYSHLITDAYNKFKRGDLEIDKSSGWPTFERPNTFYIDEKHNVYKRNVNNCCVPDVATAKADAVKNSTFYPVNLPANHTCNRLTNEVFLNECNALCKDKNSIYRGDLKGCIPKNQKCEFQNHATCDDNSPFKADFENHCSRPTAHWVSHCNQCNINWCSKRQENAPMDISTEYNIGTDLSVWGCDKVNDNTQVVRNRTKGKAKQGGVYVIEPAKNCSTTACKENPLSVHTNTCVDGQPYYTYVGTYDDTVGMVKKLWKLKSEIDNNTHAYTLFDPKTNTLFGTIDAVHIWDFLSLYKIQISGKSQKYNVVSLSFKLNSIEIYSEAESKHNTKYYHLKKDEI